MFTKLSEDEFYKFSKLIHEMSGIYLKDSKLTLLSNRLRNRLKQHNFETFDEYYNYINTSRDFNEIIEMLNAVSTNETYFFRNEKHFDALFEVVIPELFAKKRAPVTIWSAGCSTGEEPYTIAMLAKERGLLDRKYIRIDASDINTQVLDEAKIGIYDDKKLRSTDGTYLKKYFTGTENGLYKISDEIINSVHFFRFNLIRDTVDKKYDVIFCRNVMIYFDKNDQKRVVDTFYDSLNDESYFFIGHSESLYFIDNRFQYKKVLESPIYYKGWV